MKHRCFQDENFLAVRILLSRAISHLPACQDLSDSLEHVYTSFALVQARQQQRMDYLVMNVIYHSDMLKGGLTKSQLANGNEVWFSALAVDYDLACGKPVLPWHTC